MTVSPEDAFHNTTVEYGILIKQRMTMRMKLVELRKTMSENEIKIHLEHYYFAKLFLLFN